MSSIRRVRTSGPTAETRTSTDRHHERCTRTSSRVTLAILLVSHPRASGQASSATVRKCRSAGSRPSWLPPTISDGPATLPRPSPS